MKSLTAQSRKELQAVHRRLNDRRYADRIKAVLLIDDGYCYEKVARILLLDDATIRRYVKIFIQQGLDTLIENRHRGGVTRLDKSQEEELKEYLSQNLYQNSAAIIEYVEGKYGVSFTVAGITILLKRLGFVYKKPVRIPGKADSSRQEAFIEEYLAFKETMGGRDKIYFIDSVHPQHNSMPAYGWILKGEKKKLKSNTGRRRININGALDPDSLEVIVREDKTIDSASTINLLKMLESYNPDSNKIVVFVDNARYYRSSEVSDFIQSSDKLEMIFLPPYAPNLNLIERLWGFFKKKVLYNTYFETFEQFRTACIGFFEKIPKYHSELSDIITEEFQLIEI